MKNINFKIISIFSVLFISLIMLTCKETKDPEVITFTEPEIVESHVYLLGRALAVRQETKDLSEAGISYNSIKYNEAGKAAA